ncbi:hypothetical protein Oter_0139 [Opitutus terrae PB90-1]|uniref:Uncharacterized protein n=1 Tax=Opitutus terrae (strain DSM 11246 / JCM 15787 / PB90-1) TaxID=452637 RepID=B1ZN61_OPITP|nr:hypothetical protein Oter_0139 [Opitutus terrae PB90-1]
MKPLLLCACCTLCSAFAAPSPAPFSETRIDAPALSLLDSARERLPAVLPDVRPVPRWNSTTNRAPRLTSQMPVIPPPRGPDYKLRIAHPDESVDYKILIKRPALERAR